MHMDITGLLSGSGYGSIAFICCLIVLEELGVPMPMAPGDLLLVLAGAAIATGRVNPLVVVAATYVSAVGGAITGREIFGRLGTAALPRIAAFLHAGKRVDTLAARLRRGGAPAVFFGRITPGFRVVTTEVSGLISIPRRTFVKGLLPAVAIYQAVFMGLGAWLGRAAWSTIEHYAPRPGEVLVLLALVVAATLVAHVLAKRIRAAAPKRRQIMEAEV